jgi:hypothetical protein
LLAITLATLLPACTTVGMHTKERAKIDYGPPITMQICLLRAPDVSQKRADKLMDAVRKEFALYRIEVAIPWVRDWERHGFTANAMFDNDLYHRELEPPCDRLVALVDRNVGDIVWGLLGMPEVLGAVDDETHTHGMVVAIAATEAQTLMPPKDAAVHEFYHLLGCPHAATLTRCYGLIAKLKSQTDPKANFVPGVATNGDFLFSREAVNDVLKDYVAKEEAKHKRTSASGAQKTK